MKKTVIINISGIVFHVDEDAYDKLKKYLDSLNHYFGNSEESREIVSDIESRIAELLHPKISEIKQSVSIEDIDEILSVLGTPEDIAASDNAAYEQPSGPINNDNLRPSSRRLYRDIDNSYIGGICSGFGAYFKIDPIFFRILFIALIFAGGISIIIYPILWIVVPAARTSAQKLEMRGQDINLSNIEKTVREEFQHVKKGMDKPDSLWNRIGDFFREIFTALGSLIRAIFKLLSYAFGMFLILVAIFFAIALIGFLYFKNFSINGSFNEHFTSVQDFLYNIVSPISADTLLFLLFIILLLPIIGMIYAGLKILIRFKAHDRWIILALSIFWILSLFSCAVLVFKEVDNFHSEDNIKEIVTLTTPSTETLYITAPGTTEKNDEFIRFFSNSRLFFPTKSNNLEELSGVVSIDIEETSSATPEIEIIKEARGEDHTEAQKSAKKIVTSFSQKDTLLTLDPFFHVFNDKRWKFYKARMIIRLPVGTKLFLNENIRYLLDNIKNDNDYWKEDMVNKTWIMTSNGLELMGSNHLETKSLVPFGEKTLNLQERDHYSIDQDKVNKYVNNNEFGHLMIDGKKFYYGTIQLEIRKCETDKVLIELLKTAGGANSKEATILSNAIEYNFDQNDSVLWLDPIFRFPESNHWSDQKLKVIVRLPIQRTVFISSDLEPTIGNMAEDMQKWSGEVVNQTWKMANEGLVKVEK
jgi:phage shock protein PspC (stress-responsive transcriptional regulator)